MSDDGLCERVETFVANHPDAAPIDVLARCPGVEPTDPDHRATVAAVLDQDIPDVERGDHPDHPPVDSGSDEGGETTGSPDTATDSPLKGRSRDANPGCETPGTPPRDSEHPDDETTADTAPVPPAITNDVFPTDLADENAVRWLTWKETDDGRKVPRAPYENRAWPGKFVSAQDPEIWTDLPTARKWADHLPGFDVALNVRDRDAFPEETLVLIDYDDARDPETGRVHPIVREHVERAGSYSGRLSRRATTTTDVVSRKSVPVISLLTPSRSQRTPYLMRRPLTTSNSSTTAVRSTTSTSSSVLPSLTNSHWTAKIRARASSFANLDVFISKLLITA